MRLHRSHGSDHRLRLMELTHLPPAATRARRSPQVLRRDGAVVVDDLVSPMTCIDRFFDEMAPHVDATPMGADDVHGLHHPANGWAARPLGDRRTTS